MNPYASQLNEESAPKSPDTPNLTLGVIFGRFLISLIAWAIHILVAAGVLIVFLKTVPMSREFAELQDLDLAPITELTYRISILFVNYSYLLGIWLLLFDLPTAVAVCYLPRHYQWVTWIWFTSFILLGFLLVVFAAIGVCLPFVDVTTKLS